VEARLLTGFLPAVRPVLLAMMAASCWLVWGAGTAQAAVPAPDPEATLQQSASSPLAESVPLPAPPVISSDEDGAEASAPALVSPDTGFISPVTAVVSPVTGLSDALLAAADPALTGATETVSGLAPAVPQVEQLLPVPLSEVLPLPDVLPLPEPLPALVADLLPSPVQVLLPDLITLPTPAPGAVPSGAPVIRASGAARDPGVSVPLSPAETQDGAPGALPASVPEFDGSAGTVRTFGFSPAQDRAGPAVPGITATLPVPPGAPGTPGPLRISALPGQAGSGGPTSHGGAGGSGGAADIAGSWPELPATTGAINRSGADTLPAGPSFDPGSSPD
jgi:hypothetical protein